MTLRIASLLIYREAWARGMGAVALRQPARQLGKAREALGPSCRPAAIEEDDEARGAGGEVSHQLRAQGPDLGGALIVEEVEVVQEAGRLSYAHPEQGVKAAVGGIEDLHGVPRRDPLEIAHHLPDRRRLVPDPAGAGRLHTSLGQEDQRQSEARREGQAEEPPVREGRA